MTRVSGVDVLGRVILLPPFAGQTRGVTLILLATAPAPEVTWVDDVGQKGELPILLKSFRHGPDAAR